MNRFCHLTPGTGTMVRSTVASDFVDKAVDVDGRAVSMQVRACKGSYGLYAGMFVDSTRLVQPLLM